MLTCSPSITLSRIPPASYLTSSLQCIGYIVLRLSLTRSTLRVKWISNAIKLSVKNHNFVNLFSGSAPMLRHFTALSHRIDINAPWVHNLRTLQIGMAYDTSEILTVLDATPNLEQLLCAMPTRTEVGDETVCGYWMVIQYQSLISHSSGSPRRARRLLVFEKSRV